MTEPEKIPELDAQLSQSEMPQAEPLSRSSPGQRLREARVAHGLSIAEVTQTIKFSSRQIEAIEQDEFGQLPGNTFIRGMVRSYSKLLRLDEAPLLAMLNEHLTVDESALQTPQDLGAELPSPGVWRNTRPVIMLAVLVVLVVIALAAASYFGWPAPPKPKAAPDNPLAVKPIAATPQATLVPMQTTVSSNLSAAAVPPTTDVRELAFVFNDKSWVEVKDATGEVIFAQNNAPGTRQVVSGKPPFDLVIGNAAHVIAQLDGKPIDLRPYTKVEVARLRVE